MPTYVPPKKNTQLIDYVALVSQASTLVFQSNPTIASGDFKVSTDGAALANLGTLPTVTPSSSKLVKYTLSTSEMNGDNIAVLASDAAGAEWCDRVDRYATSAQQVDDLFALGATLPAGAIAALGILDNGTAGTVADTTHLPLRSAGGAAFRTDALKDRAMWVYSATTGKGTVVTLNGNTNANPPIASFDAPADPLTVGDTTVVYVIFAQASQSTTNLPTAIAPALPAKYGSYTDKQFREILITFIKGLKSGLVAGSGSASVEAPDGTAGTITYTIDANGNVTAFSFTE